MRVVSKVAVGAAVALAAAASGCSLLSLAELDAGGGGEGGATSATATASDTSSAVTASSTSGGEGGAGGTTPTGTCIPPLFHVDFEDADTSLWAPAVLAIEGDTYSDLTDDPVRSGTGAWQIALPEGEQHARLRHNIDYEEGESYWLGVSQAYVTPALGDAATNIIWGQCAADPYPAVFDVEMAVSTPGQPFSASVFGDGGTVGPESTLETVVPSAGFNDWVIHWVPSEGDDGLYEVFHEGARVFRASGANLPVGCSGTIALRIGITRYTQDSTPAQTLVQDEIRLLRGDHAEADALYTLDPDSGCE